MPNNGWHGRSQELAHYLATVGADRHEDGSFILYHGEVAVFMGAPGQDEDPDVVVSDSIEYSVDGKRCNLAAGLASTSYGMCIGVY